MDLGSLFQNSNFARKFQEFITPKREKRHSYPVPKIAQLQTEEYQYKKVVGSMPRYSNSQQDEDNFDEEWSLPKRGTASFRRDPSFPLNSGAFDHGG